MTLVGPPLRQQCPTKFPFPPLLAALFTLMPDLNQSGSTLKTLYISDNTTYNVMCLCLIGRWSSFFEGILGIILALLNCCQSSGFTFDYMQFGLYGEYLHALCLIVNTWLCSHTSQCSCCKTSESAIVKYDKLQLNLNNKFCKNKHPSAGDLLVNYWPTT